MNYLMVPGNSEPLFSEGFLPVSEVQKTSCDLLVPEDAVNFFSLFNGKGPAQLRAMQKKFSCDGAYQLQIDEKGISVFAGDPEGFRYAANRLKILLLEAKSSFAREWNGTGPITGSGRLQFQDISDAPLLPMRGMHFYLPAMRHLSFKDLLNLLDAMAKWNMNTVIFEYENRFPFRKHRVIKAPGAFSVKEIQKLLSHAAGLGLQVIPLHQSLGHVNHILRHSAYASLREEEVAMDQWCPLNPDSFALFKELLDQILELHGSLPYLHIGGDETRRLGQCEECAEKVRKEGAGKLYTDYMNMVISYVRSLGMTPILWDDMLCRHSETLNDLSRDAVLMYWDYWTVANPSAMFVARPAGKGQAADRRWRDLWRGELDSVERSMLDTFGHYLDFETELSQHFLRKFAPYLGSEFPKRIKAFPYLEYYMDHGFRVICAGASSANHTQWRGLSDYPRFAENLFTFGERAGESGSMGLISTNWYPMPVEAYFAGIVFAGQASWGCKNS